MYPRKARLAGAGFPINTPSACCADDPKAVIGSCLAVCTGVFQATVASVAVDTVSAIPVAAAGNTGAPVDVVVTRRTCETGAAQKWCWFDGVALCGTDAVPNAAPSTEPWQAFTAVRVDSIHTHAVCRTADLQTLVDVPLAGLSAVPGNTAAVPGLHARGGVTVGVV